MKTKKHILISYPIVLITVILDQVTKFVFAGANFTLINGILSIYDNPEKNTGAAWGIFSGKVTMLIILSLCFLAFLIFITHRFKEKNALYSVGYAFIIGGAFGNLIDRVFKSGVRDFIKFDFINFPIFNLADAFLVIGTILFCVFIIFFYPDEDKENKAKITKTKITKK